MVTMSGIWDSTADVLRGRGAILTRIAVPALFLPAVVRDGWTILSGAPSAPTVMVGGVIGFAALLLMIWGQLAVVSVASDPDVDAGDAARQAGRRFLPALGVYAIAGLVVGMLAVPLIVALVASHIDFAALGRGESPAIPAGIVGFAGLYLLALVVVGLFVGARLFLLNPVIVNERSGIRAFARSWFLTRGLTWRIVGVTLLFVIVLSVATAASQAVLGIVTSLLLGNSGAVAARFVTAIVSAAFASIYMVVVSVFTAQLYVTVSGRRAADVFA
ncbi:hypothetical protein SAMN05192583_0387 [Sphingomonas gellani]|uniref:DUF7847 domain-containing protein n=1 Tax=Sphingomonas gellani TaxID=1166340 RepID=A0A1H7YV66_9SPHN|nr:hypothetical protein [Sphingomonas gellani]SEM49049.1 hypothetical protein SAMN05192583_0387 [Sphingomonas gellani]